MQALPKIINKGYGLFDFFIPLEEEKVKTLIGLAFTHSLTSCAFLWDGDDGVDKPWVNLELRDGTLIGFNCKSKFGSGIWMEDFYRPVGEEIYDGTIEPTEPSLDNILHVAMVARQMLALAKEGLK